MIALSWLTDAENLTTKWQKRAIYVNNRIDNVVKLCSSIHEIRFAHVGAEQNSADYVTRCVSSSVLRKTTYYTGPTFLGETQDLHDWLIVPNPSLENDPEMAKFTVNAIDSVSCNGLSDLVNVAHFSSFRRAVRVLQLIRRFILKLKTKLLLKSSEKYSHFSTPNSNTFADCEMLLIKLDQMKSFPDVHTFMSHRKVVRKKVPGLISRFNLFLDPGDQLIKVKSKMGTLYSTHIAKYPILLDNKSEVVSAMIMDIHKRCAHGGIYQVLNLIRKKYFILKAFSAVKSILKECTHCKRFNSRATKVNANDYKDFLVEQKQHLYSTCYVDYFGPFTTLMGKESIKTYCVLFKCIWSKSLNVEVVFSGHKGFFIGFPKPCVPVRSTNFIICRSRQHI